MFLKKVILLILLAAFALLATPALANDRVTKLVVRNNLKNGRQFEAVFQPGRYVLHPETKGHAYAKMELHVISNPSPACFVRNDLNHLDHIEVIDRLLVEPDTAWRYFELQDTCFLRFEISNYRQGAVNIRKVSKVKTVELTGEWQEVRFDPGRWTGSAKHGFFTAEYRFDRSNKGCFNPSDSFYGFANTTNFTVGAHWAFNLDAKCVLEMRGVKRVRTDDLTNKYEPQPTTIVFVKSK